MKKSEIIEAIKELPSYEAMDVVFQILKSGKLSFQDLATAHVKVLEEKEVQNNTVKADLCVALAIALQGKDRKHILSLSVPALNNAKVLSGTPFMAELEAENEQN